MDLRHTSHLRIFQFLWGAPYQETPTKLVQFKLPSPNNHYPLSIGTKTSPIKQPLCLTTSSPPQKVAAATTTRSCWIWCVAGRRRRSCICWRTKSCGRETVWRSLRGWPRKRKRPCRAASTSSAARRNNASNRWSSCTRRKGNNTRCTSQLLNSSLNKHQWWWGTKLWWTAIMGGMRTLATSSNIDFSHTKYCSSV